MDRIIYNLINLLFFSYVGKNKHLNDIFGIRLFHAIVPLTSWPNSIALLILTRNFYFSQYNILSFVSYIFIKRESKRWFETPIRRNLSSWSDCCRFYRLLKTYPFDCFQEYNVLSITIFMNKFQNLSPGSIRLVYGMGSRVIFLG